ncbi:MAG: DUF2752 domain-containing protein [Phycisphaerales bacterium]|nr:DUF2752 domain-containing protein [Phycisphaerales bacterium]
MGRAARLAQRYPVFHWWCGPLNRAFAWLALAVCLVHPPHGSGISLCLTRKTLGVDCPGCGLTRSVCCNARGMFLEGWHYHPFGFAFLLLFIAIATVSLLPLRSQLALARSMERRRRLWRAVGTIAMATFLTFGLGRTGIELITGSGSADAAHAAAPPSSPSSALLIPEDPV